MTSIKQKLTKKELLFLTSITFCFLLILPVISLARSSNDIFVDDDASEIQDGSNVHPYKTISQAIKKSDNNSDIFVKKGTYKENIEIPKGVKIEGEDMDKVIIEADDNDLTTIKMKDKTKLMKVTVKGGREGIKVKEGDKAIIYKCVIKKSKGNGIFIEKGNKKKTEEVSIIKSEIKGNKRTGIFSQGRKVVIQDSEIFENGSDGIDLGSNSRAWIEDNSIKQNSGSGIKIELDGAEVYTKSNSISSNKREGVEVNLKWKAGTVVLKKDKIKNNRNYGVARVQRSVSAGNLWGGLSVEPSVEFIGNDKGNISHIFRIF